MVYQQAQALLAAGLAPSALASRQDANNHQPAKQLAAGGRERRQHRNGVA